MAKADIELLFGVKGGGSVSGESGKKISDQLTNIINNINRKPFEIKVKIDDKSIKNISNEINKAVRGSNTKGSNKTLTLGTAEYEKALARINQKMKSIREDTRKWSAAANGSTSDDYKNLQNQITALGALETRLESGTLSMKDFTLEMSKIDAVAKSAANNIHLFGENSKAISDDKALQEYYNQLTKVNKAILDGESYMDAMLLSGRGSSDEFKNISDAVSELKKLKDILDKDGLALKDFSDKFGVLDGIISSNAANMKLMEGATNSFGDKLKQVGEKFGIWLSSAEVIHKLYEITKKVVTQVSEIDTAMTELRKVTDETNTTYAKFLEDSSSRASSLGATMSEVINASADFARLGYSLEGASALADAAIVYKNVGDGINDINSASESIISTMQAFKISAEDAMLVVDKFNNVGNNFAISSGGIGDALLNSAASLHAAGNTLDESIALIAAANTTIQNPERVGEYLRPAM